MQLTTSFLLAALATLASAGDNAFTLDTSSGLTSGTAVNITWTPSTSGTVTLRLMQGAPSDLSLVDTIAKKTENDGSYNWTPSKSLPEGSDYALAIVDDGNSTDINYTPLFTINSTVSASASASSTPSSTPSSSSSSSSAKTTPKASLTSASVSSGNSSSFSSNSTATKTGSQSVTLTSASASATITFAMGGGVKTFKVGGSSLALVGALFFMAL